MSSQMKPEQTGAAVVSLVLSVSLACICAKAGVVAPDFIHAAPGVRATVAKDGTVDVTAPGKVDEVTLVWRRSHSPGTRYFRNDWAQTGGGAGWTAVSDDAGTGSAWYCMVREDDGRVDGWGVEVQPNAFCRWQVTTDEVRLVLDVRAGARPVNLNGRTLKAAKLVMRRGKPGERAWAAARMFCRMMCRTPRTVKMPVYGFCTSCRAGGGDVAKETLADARTAVSLCEGLENRPYVIIDDGWQRCPGPDAGEEPRSPWEESGERFGMEMKPFADAVAALDAKPGLCYSPYRAWEGAPSEMRLETDPACLDPSFAGAAERIAGDVGRFRSWGMKLVAVDGLAGDVAGAMTPFRPAGGRPVANDRIWRDDSRTTCEVILDHCRAMRQAAGDGVVLVARNAFDHLVAGIFEIQFTGPDTGGEEWGRTRDSGINALAARSPHDKAFYAGCAGPVGLAWDGAIDWSLNSQWLDLVARSGTPLFVAWPRALATPPVREALRDAFARAARPEMTAEPLDWEASHAPRRWLLSGSFQKRYEWDGLAAMGPGKLIDATGVKDEKDLRRLYDRMHRLRVEYVAVAPHLRNAGNVAFGMARSSRTLGAGEIPDLASRERFLDFSAKAPNTRGRELAHAVIAATPVMVLACDPHVYRVDRAFKFVKGLPTVYDETRILNDGVTARRSGRDWYVACENTGGGRTVKVDLSFLGAGERRMFAFAGSDICIDRKVRTDETLSFDVGAGDGFALRLTPPVTLFLAGDSTLAPRREWKCAGSWGEHLAPHLRDEVRIVDGAWGGRSSKSLRGGGHWDEEIAPYVGEGDWVLLQFGANDAVKNQPYRSCTPYEYSTNLANYVSEVRAKGANAVICSPITSRRYDRSGTWQEKNSLQPYVDAAAGAAAALDVPYVDMAGLTSRIVSEAGAEGSVPLYCRYFNGTDDVHPTKDGAKKFAAAFAGWLRGHPENAASALLRPADSPLSLPAFEIPGKTGPSQRLAVEELKRHLSGKADEVPYTFVFGRPDDAPDPGPFTSHYRVRGGKVWFWGDDSGEEKKVDFGESRGHHPDPLRNGTLFAVELFAERELGYRWIWPGKGGTVVERVRTLRLPEAADGSFETPLAMAHIRNYYRYGNVPWHEVAGFMPCELYDTPRGATFEERGIWQLRQRMQDRDIFRYGHAFTDWQDRFEKTHPEYLALCFNPKTGRGERGFTGPYRGGVKHCVASEGGVDRIIADWKAKGAPKYINVCENDGTYWCECDECLALDVPRPSVEDLRSNKAHLTDRYVNFWNRIARKAVAVRPDVMLVTYAYSAYRYPPRRERLEYPDNMLLGYVFGATDDWKGMLEAWRAVGMRHFFNRPNHLHYMGSIPAGLARYLYDEFQGMRGYGMMGCDYDATGNRRQFGLEFYTIARLCANPDESFERIFDDFCSAYGAAKDEVRVYYEAVERDGGAARAMAQRNAERKVEDFDGEQQRKVPLLQAYGRNERELSEKRDLAAGIYARHRIAGDLTDAQLDNLRMLALDAEHAVLVYRFIDALENQPLDELETRADRLQSFRLEHYRELPDDYAGMYRRWWAEIQFWKHYNRRRAAEGAPPPAPPGPEGWAFRRELAADPPPEFAPPAGKPWLENRISRCFFSPIKRPPFNRDELKDDIDYYPDNYLERLRCEGVNGLWLSLALSDLDDAGLAKLRRTVEKCASHGIKVWAFGIEPKNRPHDHPFFLAHPDARGPRVWDGNHVNCPSSQAVLDELEEKVARLSCAVPGLAGMINIANGERATTCLSTAVSTSDTPGIQCPVCSNREPWRLYADIAGAMVKGLRRGNPQARLITWFYHPNPSAKRGAWVYECVRHVPDGAEMQYNFESGAEREQLGKTRHGGDYWLSFPGPSDPFRRMSEAARGAGQPLSAKIQTSCSHECATVPYVPVPGLLYRKFKGMREAGVKDVMMCWYFGNAPGLMNRAAGLLACEDFTRGEAAFLADLAKDEWGGDAAVLGDLWHRFSDAYSHYPLSNDIQYYGPFHAGFSWPLYPAVSMRSLQRTWKPVEKPGGDLLGEALSDFTLEEAHRCAAEMSAELEGVRHVLARLREKYAADVARRRDLGIMVTLANLFESAGNIFRFYILRCDAVFASRDGNDFARALACAGEMAGIIRREKEISREMIPLCDDDSRIGFHSEAQAHQFNSAYLAWRVGELERAETELRAAVLELKAGRPWPLSLRERRAKTIPATTLPDGSVVISGKCPALEKGHVMELRTYDLCGTAPARVYNVVPTNGMYRVVLPASGWKHDPRLRPAWAVVRQGRDFNNGGTVWARPDMPMFPEPRLHQDALTGDNFARIDFIRGE